MYVSVYTLVHKLLKTLPKCSPPVYTTQHHPTSMVKPCIVLLCMKLLNHGRDTL